MKLDYSNISKKLKVEVSLAEMEPEALWGMLLDLLDFFEPEAEGGEREHYRDAAATVLHSADDWVSSNRELRDDMQEEQSRQRQDWRP